MLSQASFCSPWPAKEVVVDVSSGCVGCQDVSVWVCADFAQSWHRTSLAETYPISIFLAGIRTNKREREATVGIREFRDELCVCRSATGWWPGWVIYLKQEWTDRLRSSIGTNIIRRRVLLRARATIPVVVVGAWIDWSECSLLLHRPFSAARKTSLSHAMYCAHTEYDHRTTLWRHEEREQPRREKGGSRGAE